MRILVLAACLSTLPLAALAADCGGHGDPSTMVVSTSWVADHAKDPNLVLLAVGDAKEFAAAHIPGSALVDFRAVAPPIDGLSTQLPPMSDLAAAFANLGVNDDSHVVIYVTKNLNQIAARVYLTLDAMGFGRKASILNGGLGAWQAEHRPVTTEVIAPKPGKVTPCEQKDVITTLDYVRTHMGKSGTAIIDARDPEFYLGTKPSFDRPGHITGAVSIPYTSVVDGQEKLKPIETLRAQFAAAGIKPGDHVVTYCHVGQQASLLYFVSRYLGYDVQLYDGSWQEWAKHPELPTDSSH